MQVGFAGPKAVVLMFLTAARATGPTKGVANLKAAVSMVTTAAGDGLANRRCRF